MSARKESCLARVPPKSNRTYLKSSNLLYDFEQSKSIQIGQYTLGIDIGGTKTIIVVMDRQGNVVTSTKFSTRMSGCAPLENVCSEIMRFLSDLELPINKLSACGFGVPGVVDPSTGVLTHAPGLIPNSIDIYEVFEKLLPLPLFIDNDVNMAAVGEAWMGSAATYRDFVFIAVGTGLGAGIVIDGKLCRGSRGYAGEIGNLQVDATRYGTYKDDDGFGFLELMGSGGGLERQLAQTEHFKDNSLLNRSATTRDIFAAKMKGDSLACDLIHSMTRYIAIAISNIVALLNPEIVVIGGGVAQAGEVFISELRSQVSQISPIPVQIVLSKLGGNAGAYGAAITAMVEMTGVGAGV